MNIGSISLSLYILCHFFSIDASHSDYNGGLTHNQQPPRLKVAILFSGLMRHLEGVSYQSWKHFFLDRYDCEVYAAFGVKQGEDYSMAEAVFRRMYAPVAMSLEVENITVIREAIMSAEHVPNYSSFFYKYYHKNTGHENGLITLYYSIVWRMYSLEIEAIGNTIGSSALGQTPSSQPWWTCACSSRATYTSLTLHATISGRCSCATRCTYCLATAP